MTKNLSRRHLIKIGGAAWATCSLTGLPLSYAKSEEPCFLASYGRKRNGQFLFALLNLNNQEEHFFIAPRRGHSMAFSQANKEVVFFDRRPGTNFFVVNLRNLKTQTQISCPQNRRFYGHGAFTKDGRYLLVCSNDLDSLTGRLLIYDSHQSYKLVDDISSGGIGPHEVVRQPQTNNFYICHGGIQTHPDSGREILNLENMKPDLSIFNLDSGLFQKFEISNKDLSLRHLDVSQNGDALVGLQDKNFIIGEPQPLVLFFKKVESFLYEAESDFDLHTEHKGYVASAALDPTSHYAVSTCPRGNSVILWDFTNQKVIKHFFCKDASGACYDTKHERFLITNGLGEVYSLKDESLRLVSQHTVQWDNHAVLI